MGFKNFALVDSNPSVRDFRRILRSERIRKPGSTEEINREAAVEAVGGKDGWSVANIRVSRACLRFAAWCCVISVKGRVSRNRDGNLRVCP